MADLTRKTAAELAAGYRNGAFSPVDVVAAILDRIEVCNQTLNAYVTLDRQGAIECATASARRWASGRPLGPADGVPTAVKDVLLTRGMPTLRGSKLIDHRGPWNEDAPSVARLREAGAVLLGKTTTPEYAWKAVTDSPLSGVTANPWNLSLTPGGSSGGSAAALSSGMCTWALGTDSGGSVRIPASFTGTVAFKPTAGLVPVYPASNNGTLSHHCPMARTVADCAALLDVISGFDARDWSASATPTSSFASGLEAPVKGLTIAFSTKLGEAINDPEVVAITRRAVDALADLGAHVSEAEPAFGNRLDAFNDLWFAGMAKGFAGRSAQAMADADPGLTHCVELGRKLSAVRYLAAMSVRAEMGRRSGLFHERFDVLVTPTVPITAFAAGHDVPPGWESWLWTTWTPYTYPFNMTQQPALSVPCGITHDGLPVGLQIVTRRHADALALRVGHQFETNAPLPLAAPTAIP